MLLSIIIPIYNTEKYVRDCLSSIFAQQDCSPQDYEVIVVNDGTKDQSMTIVEEFCQQSNLVVIEQENQGLSRARNTGIERSRGEYLWFVDSDDQIEQGCLSQLLALLRQEHEPDIFGLGIIRIDEQTRAEKLGHPISDKKKRHLYGRLLDHTITFDLTGPAQKYIFRKAFLAEHDLLFCPGIYHEDTDFLFRVFYWCNRYYLTPLPCYRYLLRSTGSITSSVKMKNIHDLDFIIKRMPQETAQKDADSSQRTHRYLYLHFNQLSILNVMLKIPAQPAWSEEHRKLIRNNWYTYRKIAFTGILPAIVKRSWRLAAIAVAISLSPSLYNRKLKLYLNHYGK